MTSWKGRILTPALKPSVWRVWIWSSITTRHFTRGVLNIREHIIRQCCESGSGWIWNFYYIRNFFVTDPNKGKKLKNWIIIYILLFWKIQWNVRLKVLSVGWFFFLTDYGYTVFSAVLRSRHFFGRLRLWKSEVPEPTPALMKLGRLRLKAKKGGSGSIH